MELAGKTAIVTGASGALGSEIALCLGRMGVDCVCHYRSNAGAAAECADSVTALGVKAEAVRADFSDPGSAALLIQQAQKLGPVRVLVNSGSLFKRQPIDELTPFEVGEMLNVNLATPTLLCSAFASYLKEQGLDWTNTEAVSASILNIVDVAAVKPWGGYSPYCASRAGLIGLTKSLARELAPAVTVNAIAPGIVTWPGKMDPSEEQKQLKMIPAGRFGEPKDITRTIEFLLSNDYITGQVLCIDGGRSL
jgi:NAD(P)-dependent dehydrogenase (short-subunit alcohol dehydrogenase family)